MRLIPAIAAVAMLAALSAPASAGAEARDHGPVKTLSDPGGVSRFSYVEYQTPVRSRPHWLAPRVGQLRLLTEDRTDELVPVLAITHDRYGRGWVRVRVPGRPNGNTGWVPQSALGPFNKVNTWLQIDLAALKVTLIRSGQAIFTARVGIGRGRWPTPKGEFYIRNRLRGFGRVYGPLAFGTSAYSEVLTDWPGGGVVGIHGTNQPGLLPGRVSHGCVRLRNKDILRLDKLMPVGTPVTIR